jgi:lipooligosaccharide transport system ATP-binding protein
MDHARIVAEGQPAALVREHVGREVLELRVAAGCDTDALLASLDGRLDGYELTEDALMLYAEDAEDILGSLDHDRFPTDSALVRHATLEDVFLRLTGRSLEE